MKRVKKILCFLLLAVFLTLSGAPNTQDWIKAPDKSWHLTLESALEAASKSGKKIFVFHTGSDWCGWCKKLKKDVLTTSRFRKFARKNLEFVYLDSPSKRVSMPDAQRNYNRQTWQNLRGGGGVPSALVLDSKGRRIGAVGGYRPLKNYMAVLGDLVSREAAPGTQAAVSAPAAQDAQGWLSAPEGWFNKLEPALEQAKKEKKKVLVLRTGSDWCPPCKKFGSDCLPSTEFKEFARRHLVLVYLDTPRYKSMPPEQKNYNLRTASNIAMGGGVPSFAILDAQGNKTGGFSGYSSKESFFTRLDRAMKSTPQTFKAEEEAKQKYRNLVRRAKISITGWKMAPEDPLRSLEELPETLPAGTKLSFYFDYELPPGLKTSIRLAAPGVVNQVPPNEPDAAGQGQIIRHITFRVPTKINSFFLCLFSKEYKLTALYRRIPCNIKVVK